MPSSAAPRRAVCDNPPAYHPSKPHTSAVLAVRRVMRAHGKSMLLVGEPGAGKTTVLDWAMRQEPDSVVVKLDGRRLTLTDVLRELAIALGVAAPGSKAGSSLPALISAVSKARGCATVLVDGAQDVTLKTLSDLRLLFDRGMGLAGKANLVLAARPDVMERLKEPECKGLRASLGKPVTLKPMNADETKAFLEQSLGGCAELLLPFRPRALRTAVRCSGGRPRLALTLAARAQAEAQKQGLPHVSRAVVEDVAARLTPQVGVKAPRPAARLLPLGLAMGIVLFGASLAILQPSLLADGVRALILVHSELTPLPERKPSWLGGATPPPWLASQQNANVPEAVRDQLEAEVTFVNVRPGDTLSGLCRKVYGLATDTVVEQVLAANPGLEVNAAIQPGQLIAFPALNLS